MKNSLKYGAALIALYLVVYNGSKSGTVISAGASGASKFVRSLQGRR